MGRGRSWLATALAASGFCLAATAYRPASACHIHHHAASTTAEASASAAPDAAPVPFHTVMRPWDEGARPQAVAPTSAMTPEAQILVPPAAATSSAPSPTVQDWHQTMAGSCMPPPPPCTGGTSPTAATQGATPPSTLAPPAAISSPATTTPEPSTILTAGALLGVFAWRRRAARRRA